MKTVNQEDSEIVLRFGFVGALTFLWFVLSGHVEWYILSLGVLSVLLVFRISIRMNILDAEGFPIHLLGRAPSYLAWLAARIVESNLAVARLIVRPRLEIEPHLVRFAAQAKTDLGRTCLANAITLTPGTVTLDIEHGNILVHALTRDAAEDLREGDMDRRAARLEGPA